MGGGFGCVALGGHSSVCYVGLMALVREMVVAVIAGCVYIKLLFDRIIYIILISCI